MELTIMQVNNEVMVPVSKHSIQIKCLLCVSNAAAAIGGTTKMHIPVLKDLHLWILQVTVS